MQNQKKHYPLQIIISALFIILTVMLGSLLSIQSYNRTSEIMLNSAHEVYGRITDELSLDFKASYAQVASALHLLALSPIIDSTTMEQRLEHMKGFSTALKSDPAISALQIAYENGDFFIVRSLDSDYVRSRFAAPKAALFMADHIGTEQNGSRILTRLFYNLQLQEISRHTEQTTYDPRTRPWYRQAGPGPSMTKPYLFYFISKPGVTASISTAAPGVVIASDITLDKLTETISKYQITPASEVVLINADGQTFAYQDPTKLLLETDGNEIELANLGQLDSDVLSHLAGNIEAVEQELDFEFGNRQWIGSTRIVARPGDVELFALMLTPVDELLSEAIAIRTQSFITTAIIILVFIPVIWLTTKRITAPLNRLVNEASLITHFEFDKPITTRSFIKEVDELATAMSLMKNTINRFITLINSLAGEQNLDVLLSRITRETMQISKADGALTYLLDETDNTLKPATLCDSRHQHLSTKSLPILSMDECHDFINTANRGSSSIIRLNRQDDSILKPLLKKTGHEALTVITLLLTDRNDETIGLLCLLYASNEKDIQNYDANVPFVEALSGFAAVTLQSRQMLKMQEALLNAFIKLIAGAIDAKSPYTGGHCQRVPEITRLIARAACDSNEPPFENFSLDDRQWEALDIASWLHDCGKVTTPEYVVDKSTKLETIYDRIHEIRMRFEVLKRDAEINYWQQLANGGNKTELKKQLEQKLISLDDDFAFIAECNEGGEFMAEDRIERLQKIAGYTWMRTLDDRIGISWDELARKKRFDNQPLPVEEKLLADRPDHIIDRNEADHIPADNIWGFRMDTPKHKYNRGELYNLSIARGTLGEEERYEINGHMIQTIIMLNKLPYPKHLHDVPLIAGCHHETMDGNGYPRRLSRDEMPVTGRMMAIADIFEALTASDRPYKKAKTLSEAIRIMGFMKKDKHIDPDLFRLFLENGVYLEYAHRHLDPEQIDDVDISQYL